MSGTHGEEFSKIEEIVKRIVSEELPVGLGFRLEKVEIGWPRGSEPFSLPQNFTIMIEVTKEDDRPEPPGLGYQMFERIRELWPPDQVNISLRVRDPFCSLVGFWPSEKSE